MKITKEKDGIIIENDNDFNIEDILECGQVFSFERTSSNSYLVVSLDKWARIVFDDKRTIIYTKEVEYFYNYFDLDTDYEKIKKEICLLYNGFEKFFIVGKGIRILRQDPYQTIISFIVSANNNIKRIKKILNKICERFGEKLDCGIYSFPSASNLLQATEKDFIELGAGYRSSYLVDTISKLNSKDYNVNDMVNLDTLSLRKKLLELKGIGPKVADCILFFGFHRTDVFPVDTWIKKAYEMFSNSKRSATKISEYFVSIFKNYSGYAQQYIFNYMIVHK